VAVVDNTEPQLHTDYRVTVQQVLRRLRGIQVRPGEQLVVRRFGGATTISGYNVVMSEQDFPAFNQAETYVLFLERVPGEQYFRIRYGGQGAFRVAPDGGVRQASLGRGNWNELQGFVALPAFIAEINETLTER
jgi:hypothetical protein